MTYKKFDYSTLEAAAVHDVSLQDNELLQEYDDEDPFTINFYNLVLA